VKVDREKRMKNNLIGFTVGLSTGLLVVAFLLVSDFTKKEVFVTTNLDNVCVIDKDVMEQLMYVMKPAQKEGEKNESSK
tara:strand:+ start:101 stop:337 length:237 start_codon:yes stop_codon:yes gene_type:complete